MDNLLSATACCSPDRTLDVSDFYKAGLGKYLKKKKTCLQFMVGAQDVHIAQITVLVMILFGISVVCSVFTSQFTIGATYRRLGAGKTKTDQVELHHIKQRNCSSRVFHLLGVNLRNSKNL